MLRFYDFDANGIVTVIALWTACSWLYNDFQITRITTTFFRSIFSHFSFPPLCTYIRSL